MATTAKLSSTRKSLDSDCLPFGIKIGRSIDRTVYQFVMPESILSYNITRKYSYPWFTWLVVVGGIAATALFTVLNLASDGYQSK